MQGGAWNLRKCSAAGLDMLSNVFGDELLPVLLPIVEQRLKDPSWEARESAILALGERCRLGCCWCCMCQHAAAKRDHGIMCGTWRGSTLTVICDNHAMCARVCMSVPCLHARHAPLHPGMLHHQLTPPAAAPATGAVSQGCHMGLLPHLQSLVAMLLPCLVDPEPMVRIIACWSLSRYSHWYLMPDMATQQHTPEQQARLDAVLAAVLKCMLDNNRAVQESACSALANIADDAGGLPALCRAVQPHWRVALMPNRPMAAAAGPRHSQQAF